MATSPALERHRWHRYRRRFHLRLLGQLVFLLLGAIFVQCFTVLVDRYSAHRDGHRRTLGMAHREVLSQHVPDNARRLITRVTGRLISPQSRTRSTP